MVRSLDNLPVELLHKIFDNLSTVDIYFNVSLVNRRLRNIALSYSQFQLTIRIPQYQHPYKELSPSQVCSLSLCGDNFGRVSVIDLDLLNEFDHLRSLDLTGVSNECFSRLIDHLVKTTPQLALTLFHIKDQNIEFPDQRIQDWIRFILILHNLRQISLYHPTLILALESAIPTIEPHVLDF